MRVFLCLLLFVILVSCKITTYYVVRHAEKEVGSTMSADQPLTAKGERQALALKNYLKGHEIKYIYSTNYKRTLATAEPTRKTFGVPIKIYDPQKLKDLVNELQQIRDGNVLVVGHSNTVDDVVNGLLSESRLVDLNDNEYGDVFIVKRKDNHYSFEKAHLPLSP